MHRILTALVLALLSTMPLLARPASADSPGAEPVETESASAGSVQANPAAAGTQIGGTIDADTTWIIQDSPYIVAHTVEIPTGVSLTVQPGVTVFFTPATSLLIYGRLIAKGTEDQPITFTSLQEAKQPGQWGKIRFFGDYKKPQTKASHNVAGQFAWCQITHGQGIESRYAALQIEDCTITHHRPKKGYQGPASIAIQARPHTHPSVIRRTLIEHNQGGGLSLHGTTQAIIENNTISHNQGYGDAAGIEVRDASNVTISGNVLFNNTVGRGTIELRYVKNSKVKNNVIHGNHGAGLTLSGGSELTIEKNAITRNTRFGGVLIRKSRQVRLFRNRIEDNQPHGIKSNGGREIVIRHSQITDNGPLAITLTGHRDMDATQNFWGVTEKLAIMGMLYDFFDVQKGGKILFEPFLTEAPDGIPAMPTLIAPEPQVATAKPVQIQLPELTLPDKKSLLLGLASYLLSLVRDHLWLVFVLLVGSGVVSYLVRRLITKVVIRPLWGLLRRGIATGVARVSNRASRTNTP